MAFQVNSIGALFWDVVEHECSADKSAAIMSCSPVNKDEEIFQHLVQSVPCSNKVADSLHLYNSTVECLIGLKIYFL